MIHFPLYEELSEAIFEDLKRREAERKEKDKTNQLVKQYFENLVVTNLVENSRNQ